MQIGFHHHGEQRLVDPATSFEQGGEERASSQLRNLQIQLACGRGQHPSSGAVAVGGALVGAFERAGANERGRLRLDQLLVQRLGCEANSVGNIGEFQLGEKVKQGRLV